jgi:uncharacterized membrane protein
MDERYILDRFDLIDDRLAALTKRLYALEEHVGQVSRPVQPEAPKAVEVPKPVGIPKPEPAAVAELEPRPPVPETPVPAFLRYGGPAVQREAPTEKPTQAGMPVPPSADWEAMLGGNWLNKLGVLILVIGIALALGYSYTKLGPAGRVGTSLALSFAMIGSGAALESRERYRTFARGLLGGGWAALYFTVYAMQALEPARVIHNPWLGAVLLLGVAIGMVAHSLRYRSETVTGMAYFLAFAALALTQVTALSLLVLVPLAASLLYVAHRFQWSKMAIFGLIATYATCASRPDTGAPLWQAQAVFTTYWLLFEGFDILLPAAWLLPLNALGFLGLSITKWHAAAPAQIWMLLAATSGAYLASAIFRARLHPRAGALEGGWHGAATLTALLAALAIFRKAEYHWIPIGLAAEAELFFLAGLRLRAKYLRQIAAALFAGVLLHLFFVDLVQYPKEIWIPAAVVNAVLFYANRGLRARNVLYGYAGAAMLALIAWNEVDGPYRGAAWLVLACAPFLLGWWRRMADFRFQGYLLAVSGTVATELALPYQWPALAITAAVAYGLTGFALWSGDDRFGPAERAPLTLSASLAGALAAVALLWRVLPGAALAPAWAVFACAVLAAGRYVETDFLYQESYGIAALAFLRCWATNFARNADPVLAGSIVIAALYAAQPFCLRRDRPRMYFSLLASTLLALLLYHEVSGSVLTVAWGIEGVALLGCGFPLRDRVLRLSGLALLLTCIGKLFLWDLRHLETLPRILSFLVLGLILVAVSWVYTRYRERVQKLL